MAFFIVVQVPGNDCKDRNLMNHRDIFCWVTAVLSSRPTPGSSTMELSFGFTVRVVVAAGVVVVRDWLMIVMVSLLPRQG
jgi:hypothetical protein